MQRQRAGVVDVPWSFKRQRRKKDLEAMAAGKSPRTSWRGSPVARRVSCGSLVRRTEGAVWWSGRSECVLVTPRRHRLAAGLASGRLLKSLRFGSCSAGHPKPAAAEAGLVF